MRNDGNLEENELEKGMPEKSHWSMPKLLLFMILLLIFISSAMILGLDAFTEYQNRNLWSMEIDGIAIQPGITKAEKLIEAGYILPDAEDGWSHKVPGRTSATAKIQKADQSASCIFVALINESDQEKCLKDCEVWAVDYIARNREDSGIQSILFQDQPLEQVNIEALKKQYGEPEKEEEAMLYGKPMWTYQWISGQNGLEISAYEDDELIAIQSWHIVRVSFAGIRAADETE